ncbi:hypothetical protein COU80_02020 [Candidatus Peregrinibacteria bacterium CG10_big_fil_rev_8_21_14_0_10_55_24]|nr:MAG: hypothetical protein COU80_02020 [Candidatus Peregrinibacteria bacterium CG10_big_fil_rev_8_21_14_0_10_55_24]
MCRPRIGINLFLSLAIVALQWTTAFAATLSMSAASTFDTNSPQDIAVAVLSATQAVVIYRDLDVGNINRAKVATISGDTISYGDIATFSSNLSTSVNITKLDSTHVVIGYRELIASDAKVVIGTVSGTDISFGTPVTVSDNSSYGAYVAALSSTKLLIAYRDGNNSNYGTAVIGTVSGTDITLGTESVFESSATAPHAAETLDATHAVIVFADSDNDGNVIIADASGAVPSYGSAVKFAEYLANSTTSVHSSSSLTIAYRDISDGNNGRVVAGTVSGTTPTMGSSVVFDTNTIQYLSMTALDSTNAFLAYQDPGNSNYATALMVTVSGTSATAGSATVFNSATSQIIGSDTISSTQAIVALQSGITEGAGFIATYGEDSDSFTRGGAARRAQHALRQRMAAAGTPSHASAPQQPTFTPDYSTVQCGYVLQRPAEDGRSAVVENTAFIPPSEATHVVEEPVATVSTFQERVCARVEGRFSGSSLERVNARLQQRFGWTCGE